MKPGERCEWYATQCAQEGPCDSGTPDCVCIAGLNFCEKFCACGPSYRNRYRGCKCKLGDCRTQACPCWVAGRECDPDLCSCGAPSYACTECSACSAGINPGSADARKAPAAAGAARPTPQRCRNLSIQLGEEQSLVVGLSAVAGWGLFSRTGIEKNEFTTDEQDFAVDHAVLADPNAHGRHSPGALLGLSAECGVRRLVPWDTATGSDQMPYSKIPNTVLTFTK